jgi:site-specific recombinase XerD
MQSYPYSAWGKRKSDVEYPFLSDYVKHLTDRGVEPGLHLAAATCFLDYLDAMGKSLASMSKGDIDDFVTEQGTHYHKSTVAAIAGLLRSFFRFLLVQRLVDVDWGGSVPRPRLFQGKRDPRFLKPAEVRRILARIDRTRLLGKRDFAILSLLGIYGLRAAEVAQLELDDIEWRAMVLRIRHRKCDDAFELPLIAAVAAALMEYIKARPVSAHRVVFLSVLGPTRPLPPHAVRTVAKRAIRAAGIRVTRPGSHSFRYAVAQKLFEAERPISEIASVLGHRKLASTLGYMSFAVHPLRELALNDGEDLA